MERADDRDDGDDLSGFEETFDMKIAFFILVVFHGLIHLMGFAKAFRLAEIGTLSQPITRANGTLWLISTFLFVAAGLMFILHKPAWWMIAAVAVIISQYLIFTTWHDAKFGTIANVVILLVTIVGFAQWRFYNVYSKDVRAAIEHAASISNNELLTETDIALLPEPVQKYIRYVGAIGKPKVKSFKVRFTGQIRKNEQSEWMPFTSEQYNFLDPAKRLFYMKATMKHLPVAGYHAFNNGEAFMDIRLLSFMRVQYQTGKEMGIAETVTFFNDMCVMAPATLIDQRIKWLATDGNIVTTTFTNNGITISATLFFNDKGELVNFISNDRYATADDGNMQKLPWSTPMKDYRSIDGTKLATKADAIYRYPEGDLVYGEFRTAGVFYNPKD